MDIWRVIFFLFLHLNQSEPVDLPAVIWSAPIGCDSSGFFMEIVEILMGMAPFFSDRMLFVDVGKCSSSFLKNLNTEESHLIQQLQNNFILHPPHSPAIHIQHKLPSGLFRPLKPPLKAAYRIGRMMTESIHLSLIDADAIRDVDEVWVPTEFHKTVFEKSGIPSKKLYVVPEAINVDFYSSRTPYNSTPFIPISATKNSQRPLRFLSIFKFESRKGWDTLLTAYWTAFKITDNVELIIRSYKPHWIPGPANLTIWFESFARTHFNSSTTHLPKVYWLPHELSHSELRALYHSSDAFVLPTKGEGWCLPCVEAMASGLPIIVTNFSGPTAYLDSKHSYPSYTLQPLCSSSDSSSSSISDSYCDNTSDGMAIPNTTQLAEILSHILMEPIEAREKGKEAQKYARAHFHPTIIGGIVMDRLHRIVRSSSSSSSSSSGRRYLNGGEAGISGGSGSLLPKRRGEEEL
jgi:glycosyltransferase involved in cell wall biosynthesis